MLEVPPVAIPVVTFIAGVFVTVLIRQLVTRWSSRARPALKVLNIAIGPRPDADNLPVPLDFATKQKESTNPILPQLSDTMTVGDIKEYLEKADLAIQAHHQVLGHLEKFLARPSLLQPGVSRDEQREIILREWAIFGSPLEKLAGAAISHFDSLVPQLYHDPHPDEWKDPARARVHIDGARGYNLREIDVDGEIAQEIAVQGPVGLQDKLKRELTGHNILRRFWIHLVEGDLKWLFAKILVLGKSFEQDALQLLDTLNGLVEKQSPKYLTVQALLSNDGSRSLGIKSYGYLAIPVIEDKNRPDLLVPVRLADIPLDSDEVRVVEGNKALGVLFVSTDPIEQLSIVDQSGVVVLDGPRIESLYQAKVLECRLALGLVGFGIADTKATISEKYRFGAQTDVQSQRKLATALRTGSPQQRIETQAEQVHARGRSFIGAPPRR